MTKSLIFYHSSFGYRPGKSAHDSLAQCQENCKSYGWVIDVDIKGFFDNINHEIMMRLLQEHTQDKSGTDVCSALVEG